MPTPSKKTQGPAKGASGVKSKNISTTKNDNTVQNNTSVGGDQDFLYIGKSFMQKEVEWLEKFHKLLKKKEKVDDSNKFSQNLQRLYDALLKELSTRCGETYESVFNAADDDQSETEMALNVTPRVNTKEKDLKDELAESSRKQQKLNEENNKLKDQLTSYQDKLKKFDDYKKEVDVKTEENNKLKQNMSEMKKRISEIENQQKFTIHPEKTDDALNILRDDSLNLQKKLSSQQQDLQQMQQKIDELTKKKANEKADFLKQKENPEKGNATQEKTDRLNREQITRLTKENEILSSQQQDLQQMQQKIDVVTKEKEEFLKQKENLEKGLKDANNNITTLNKDNEKNKIKLEEGDNKRIALENEKNDLKKQLQNSRDQLKRAQSENVTQGKTDSSNKEQITKLTNENEKIKLKNKELQQQQKELQQQQREDSQRSKEKINILTAEKESLETVVSQIKKQMEEEKRKINKEKKFASLGPDQKLKELQEENEKLRERLSKVTIADLGDSNRPTRLGEKFAELYDNEWTDAMEELDDAGDEKSNINTLKNIVEKSYEFGKTRAANYVKGLEKALLDVSNSIEITDTISKYIKDQRKSTSLLVLDGLYKSFVNAHSEYNVGGGGVKNLIKKAVSLCWLMAIQDPPMVLTTKLTEKFDTDRFRHYTKSGSTVDYVVWPVLFLHEGGPIICKGVAQGK